jgi:hypothetical protein
MSESHCCDPAQLGSAVIDLTLTISRGYNAPLFFEHFVQGRADLTPTSTPIKRLGRLGHRASAQGVEVLDVVDRFADRVHQTFHIFRDQHIAPDLGR